MIISTSREVRLGESAIMRGPLLDIDSLGELVVVAFPQQWWPWAIATAFAESGLASSLGAPKRRLVVWSATIGDLHLVGPRWGPSVGIWQLRQTASVDSTRWPIDPAVNAAQAAAMLEQHGPGRWASHTSGRNHKHLPAAHRWVAGWCETHPARRAA